MRNPSPARWQFRAGEPIVCVSDTQMTDSSTVPRKSDGSQAAGRVKSAAGAGEIGGRESPTIKFTQSAPADWVPAREVPCCAWHVPGWPSLPGSARVGRGVPGVAAKMEDTFG